MFAEADLVMRLSGRTRSDTTTKKYTKGEVRPINLFQHQLLLVLLLLVLVLEEIVVYVLAILRRNVYWFLRRILISIAESSFSILRSLALSIAYCTVTSFSMYVYVYICLHIDLMRPKMYTATTTLLI